MVVIKKFSHLNISKKRYQKMKIYSYDHALLKYNKFHLKHFSIKSVNKELFEAVAFTNSACMFQLFETIILNQITIHTRFRNNN